MPYDEKRVYARNLEVPSGGGVGTARAIARAYGVFATGGQELGLRPETLQALSAPAIPSQHGFYDECLKGDAQFSLGFMKPSPAWPFGSELRSDRLEPAARWASPTRRPASATGTSPARWERRSPATRATWRCGTRSTRSSERPRKRTERPWDELDDEQHSDSRDCRQGQIALHRGDAKRRPAKKPESRSRARPSQESGELLKMTGTRHGCLHEDSAAGFGPCPVRAKSDSRRLHGP